jgi:Mg2+ and Co2+ transporter CorA
VIDPQTDIFGTLSSGRVRVPGAGDEQLPYLRDIHDHLKKISDLTESFRELIAGIADVSMSQTSNQLNIVMKQLAVISTVFLPLSFLAGFFGQNFGACSTGSSGAAGWLKSCPGMNRSGHGCVPLGEHIGKSAHFSAFCALSNGEPRWQIT